MIPIMFNNTFKIAYFNFPLKFKLQWPTTTVKIENPRVKFIKFLKCNKIESSIV
jgi:hypothetical protein